VSVPSGAFVARRNGYVFVTGNSGFPKSLDVSKAIDKAATDERSPTDQMAADERKANPNAEHWAGWGTALKPSWEPIILARKPLGSACINVLDMVECQLRKQGVIGDIRWKPENASGAAKSKRTSNSGLIKPSELSETSVKTADGRGMQKIEPQTRKNSETHGTGGMRQIQKDNENFPDQPTASSEKPSSGHMAENASVAGKPNSTSSPLTTSTEEERRIEKPPMEKYMPNSGAKDFQADTECFAGIATGLTGSMETVRINRDSDGMFLWPHGLPRSVPSNSLTVASNVLEWGTGAMFIDGARVETDDVGTPIETPERERDDGWGMGFGSVRDGPASPAGRWPPNFLHDGSDEVTALFPQTNGSKPGSFQRALTSRGYKGGALGQRRSEDGSAIDLEKHGYPESGSAARFYPALPFEAEDVEAARIFYCAKASNRDRNEGLEDLPARSNAERAGRNMGRNGRAAVGGSGKPLNGTGLVDPKPNHHPTVKPTSLMRWLVRLVTPRGGTVLDPFMGSGSTGKAAVIEDFNFIGIEREAEYLEIARRRIDAARLPLFAIEASDDPAE
jgi:hypothetical protein